MLKSEALRQLRGKMEKDTSLPLREGAHQLVFGEGNPDARLYFLGEAPGRVEDETGRPFAGRAGVLLTGLLEDIGIKREDVYITSVVRYRPPNNRPPTPKEIAAFLPYVDKEIEIISPRLIVPLGRFAMEKFLPTGKISKLHGTLQKVLWNGKQVFVFPSYHPAAGLRSTAVKQALVKDFAKLAVTLEQLH
jgi:DNA polymerase